jgi:hypothetical protein
MCTRESEHYSDSLIELIPWRNIKRFHNAFIFKCFSNDEFLKITIIVILTMLNAYKKKKMFPEPNGKSFATSEKIKPSISILHELLVSGYQNMNNDFLLEIHMVSSFQVSTYSFEKNEAFPEQ